MTFAQVVDLKGKKLSEVALEPSIFGGEPNLPLLHSAVVRQLANARAGTASAKTRAEVSGGGRKPWRQKGTGRARAGSIRSPLWVGGGIVFGPKPRDYSLAMPQKMRCVALRSALAARKADLIVVKDFAGLSTAKTKEMAVVLQALGLSGKKILLILDLASGESSSAERSARNIKDVKVIGLNDLNVKDLLDCDYVLTTEVALEAISTRLKPQQTKTPGGSKTTVVKPRGESRTQEASRGGTKKQVQEKASTAKQGAKGTRSATKVSTGSKAKKTSKVGGSHK